MMRVLGWAPIDSSVWLGVVLSLLAVQHAVAVAAAAEAHGMEMVDTQHANVEALIVAREFEGLVVAPRQTANLQVG